MNHPKPEEWAPYVFGEAKSEDRRRLKDHLHGCAICREEVSSWQRSLGRLDAWDLRPRAAFRPPLYAFLKLAAAAVLVMAVGIGIGRLTSSAAGVDKVRAAIEPELRQQLKREFEAMLLAEVKQVQAQRTADYLALKKDLDTVAILTDASLRRAEQRLIELADYNQQATDLNNTPKQ